MAQIFKIYPPSTPNSAKERREEERKLAELGNDWIEKHCPKWAKAAIVAELRENLSDSMTDLYQSKTVRVVVLAWSKHERNLFPEMRKAAAAFKETEHLGPGKGLFKIVLNSGSGQTSIIWQGENGKNWYATAEEAEARAQELVSFDDLQRQKMEAGEINAFVPYVPYGYKITGCEQNIEHRQSYSGGGGYFLGHDRYSGWLLRKMPFSCGTREIAIAIARDEHILTSKGKAEKAGSPAAEGQVFSIQWRLNEELRGVEIKFPERPPETTLARMKSHKMRFHRGKGIWYGKQSPELIELCKELSGKPDPVETWQ